MNLTQFAGAIGKEIVVEHHPKTDDESASYTAHFRDAEVQIGVALCLLFGRGSTVEEAMNDYLEQIAGKTIVFNARTKSRTEVVYPIDTDPAVSLPEHSDKHPERRCPKCEGIELLLYRSGTFYQTLVADEVVKTEVAEADTHLVTCTKCGFKDTCITAFDPPDVHIEAPSVTLEDLAAELEAIEVLDGCIPEEVFVNDKEIEIVLNDNPLVPQLVFEVMAVIAKAHPKDVKMKMVSTGSYAAIIAQF